MPTAERTLTIGEQFSTMKDLRDACKDFAVQENFEFKTSHSDKKRYRIHCVSSKHCSWRLHASLITAEINGNPQAVEIRTLNEEHTCNGVRHAHHRQAELQ
jgi:MuDR family transposase